MGLFFIAAFQLIAQTSRLLFLPEERYTANYFWALQRFTQGDFFANSNVADSGALALAQEPLFAVENLSLVVWNAPLALVQSLVDDPAINIITATTTRQIISLFALYFIFRAFGSPMVSFLLVAVASTTEAIYLGFAFTQNTSGTLGVALLIYGTRALLQSSNRRALALFLLYPLAGIGAWVNSPSAFAYSVLGLILSFTLIFAQRSGWRRYLIAGTTVAVPLLLIFSFIIFQTFNTSLLQTSQDLWFGRNSHPGIVATGFGKWSMLDNACFPSTSLCLPYEPFAAQLTRAPYTILRWALLVLILILAIVVARKRRALRERAVRGSLDWYSRSALLLSIATGLFLIAASVGYFDFYWQVRDHVPLLLDAWREPWAKWSTVYVISGLCLASLTISEYLRISSPGSKTILRVTLSLAVLILIVPTFRPVPEIKGLLAPSAREMREVVSEVDSILNQLPPGPVCVGNVNGRQGLTQLSGMALASRGVDVLFSSPDQACSDTNMPVVLLFQEYPDEQWDPYVGFTEYSDAYVTLSRGRHLALLLPT